jgi:hypothetical protein
VEVRGLRGGRNEVLVLGALDRPAVAAGAMAALALRRAVAGVLSPGAAGLGGVADPIPFLDELAAIGIKAAVFEGSS